MVRAGLTDKMLIDAEEVSTNMTVSGQSWATEQELCVFYHKVPQRKTEWVEFLDRLVTVQKFKKMANAVHVSQ